jgi:hypothetical protein
MKIIPDYRNGEDLAIYLGLFENMYISNPLVRLKDEKNVLSNGRDHTYLNNTYKNFNIVFC